MAQRELRFRWLAGNDACALAVGFIGVARDEETHLPTPYLESLPPDLSEQPVMLLDPMLATGGSMAYAISLLQCRNAVDITAVCVVTAPEGLAAVEKVAPGLKLGVRRADPKPEQVVRTVIPAPVRYAGMAADRFWELEDSQVNLNRIEGDPMP